MLIWFVDADLTHLNKRNLFLHSYFLSVSKRELNLAGTFWQEEFFDHVVRSSESYSQKWDYVKENPVRAALVKRSDEWPWQGEVESLTL